jgi:KGK domain
MFQELSEDSVFRLFHLEHDIQQKINIRPVKTLYQSLREMLGEEDSDESEYDWFRDGIDCQIILDSENRKGWIDGKIRIRAAFSENKSYLNHSSERVSDWIFLQDTDTIAVTTLDDALGMRQNIFLRKDLTLNLRSRLNLTDMRFYRYGWLDDGIPCQTLLIGEEASDGWLDGRIRLQIEFKSNIEETSIEPSLDTFRESP